MFFFQKMQLNAALIGGLSEAPKGQSKNQLKKQRKNRGRRGNPECLVDILKCVPVKKKKMPLVWVLFWGGSVECSLMRLAFVFCNVCLSFRPEFGSVVKCGFLLAEQRCCCFARIFLMFCARKLFLLN